MISLLDDNNKGTFGLLYHVAPEGAVTCVKYGPGQLQLAKEYIPRGARHYIHYMATKRWRMVIGTGHVKDIDHCDIPKEIQLYLFLLGD